MRDEVRGAKGRGQGFPGTSLAAVSRRGSEEVMGEDWRQVKPLQ